VKSNLYSPDPRRSTSETGLRLNQIFHRAGNTMKRKTTEKAGKSIQNAR
jgi:hypothetical protein